MTEQEKRNLINRYLDAYNSFNINGMITAVHPEIEFKDVSGGEVTAAASGVGEFRRMAKQTKKLFTSRQQKVTAFSATEEGASIQVEYEGVLAVDLPNGMKAGEKLRLKGKSEFHFKDGKISWIADYS